MLSAETGRREVGRNRRKKLIEDTRQQTGEGEITESETLGEFEVCRMRKTMVDGRNGKEMDIMP